MCQGDQGGGGGRTNVTINFKKEKSNGAGGEKVKRSLGG